MKAGRVSAMGCRLSIAEHVNVISGSGPVWKTQIRIDSIGKKSRINENNLLTVYAKGAKDGLTAAERDAWRRAGRPLI